MHFLFDNDSTPFEFISNHIHMVGWPALCGFFYWIGRKIQNGIHVYKEDRKLLADTKAAVDTKTDKAILIMGETKQVVDTMMTNHLHTIENKVDQNNDKSDKMVELLTSIDKSSAVQAEMMKVIANRNS